MSARIRDLDFTTHRITTAAAPKRSLQRYPMTVQRAMHPDLEAALRDQVKWLTSLVPLKPGRSGAGTPKVPMAKQPPEDLPLFLSLFSQPGRSTYGSTPPPSKWQVSFRGLSLEEIQKAGVIHMMDLGLSDRQIAHAIAMDASLIVPNKQVTVPLSYVTVLRSWWTANPKPPPAPSPT